MTRTVEKIEADYYWAMGSASNYRKLAEVCLAPQGVADLEFHAARFDRLAASFKEELDNALAGEV